MFKTLKSTQHFQKKKKMKRGRKNKKLKIKNLGDYPDLYMHSNTLLVSHVFESFHDKYIKITQLTFS